MASIDGYTDRQGTTYPPYDNSASFKAGSYIQVGQKRSGVSPDYDYWQWRGYVSFNTTSIPDDETVTTAILSLKTYLSLSGYNFYVQIDGGTQPIYGDDLTPEDWGCGSVSILAEWHTSNWQADTYVNFSIPTTQINKTGLTQFEIVSNKDRLGNSPVGNEYGRFYSGNSEGNEPKLYVSTYILLPEEEPPASGGKTGDEGGETGGQTTVPELPEFTVPKFHIPIWGYYLILGSIGIVAFASILTKPKHRRGSPRGIKVKKNQKRYPKRNKKGKFTK